MENGLHEKNVVNCHKFPQILMQVSSQVLLLVFFSQASIMGQLICHCEIAGLMNDCIDRHASRKTVVCDYKLLQS